MRFLLSSTDISNEALMAEFNFWKTGFLTSASLATVFGLVTGALILVWPEDAGNPELRAFARDVWTAFVECGFWFGFLAGLLWTASRRIGCALSGTAPWSRNIIEGHIRIARLLGQTGCALACGSALLWMATYFAYQFAPSSRLLFDNLISLVVAGLVSSALFVPAAIVLRCVAAVR